MTNWQNVSRYKSQVDCEQFLFFFAKLLHAKTKHSSGELSREQRETRPSQSLIVITSWFAIALDEIRTRRILGEKEDSKQSKSQDAAQLEQCWIWKIN